MSQTVADRVYTIVGKGLHLNTREDAREICNDLERMADTLEEIHFSGNTFGVDAAKAVSEKLALAKGLRVANLSDMFTGRLREEIPFALEALGDALVDKEKLEKVDLSDNAFGPAGAQPLFKLFSENVHIKHILLNNNGLGVTGGNIFAKALLQCAKKSRDLYPETPTALRTLVCGRNRLENGSMASMAEALEAHGHLHVVRMKQNGIRPEGIETLINALSKNPHLHVLDLQDNTFTASATQALAKAVHNWKNLRELNVGDCLLSAKGSHSLALSLVEKSNLDLIESLFLGYAEMEEDAALLLADAVSQMKMLSTLDLNGNVFDPEGAAVAAIKKAIKSLGKDFEEVLLELDDMEWDESDSSSSSSSDTSSDEGESESETEAKQDQVDELAKVLESTL